MYIKSIHQVFEFFSKINKLVEFLAPTGAQEVALSMCVCVCVCVCVSVTLKNSLLNSHISGSELQDFFKLSWSCL